jgi:hypothetical protein
LKRKDGNIDSDSKLVKQVDDLEKCLKEIEREQHQELSKDTAKLLMSEVQRQRVHWSQVSD